MKRPRRNTAPAGRSRLRTARIILSTLFGLLYTALFLEIFAAVPRTAALLNALQIFPSSLKAVSVSVLFLIVPVFLLVLTAVFGRFYCAMLCPLGAMQDLALYGVRKLDKSYRLRRQRPFSLLHYSVLGAVILSLVLGSTVLPGLLEPYTLFGRFIVDIFRRFLISVWNGVVSLAQAAGIYTLNRADPVPVSGIIASVSILFLAGLVCMTVFLGRKFCNTLCPTGALLRLLSRFSLFRIRLSPDDCISCGLCESVCRAGCIDNKNRSVDPARCVLCLDCLTVCRESAIRYGPAVHSEAANDKRRTFLKMAAGAALSIPFFRNWSHAAPAARLLSGPLQPILPPGSVSRAGYQRLCTACHRCVSACPNRIIRPTLFEFGLTGLFQPVLDYRNHFCAFECNACTQVCPTGAIRPLSLPDKKLTRIGLSRLDKTRCIVYEKKTECGACAEHCPNKAVHLVNWNGLGAPETDDELCIGCGACEYACPVLPKAIVVHGLAIQEKARPRQDRRLERKRKTADFPF